MQRILHTRTQHPVGQGGFHTGSVAADDAPAFRYVYDCGSTNVEALVDRIDYYGSGRDPIDILFLSHLDQDHTNGIDRLLELVSVDTVAMPYLTPFERVLLVSEAAAQPTGTTSAASVVDFLGTPVQWLSRRGVKRVVLVRAASQMPEGGIPNAQRTDGPTESLSAHYGETEALPESEKETFGTGCETRIMPAGPITLRDGNLTLWLLVPHVYPEPEPLLDQFRTAVARLLRFRTPPAEDSPRWFPRLRQVIGDRETRRELAALYTAHVRRDRNLTSMSLYSGFHEGTDRVTISVKTAGRRFYGTGRHPVGWLGTGDARLSVAARLTALRNYYGTLLDGAMTVMLPHHGSRHNARPDFIHSFPWRPVWIAAHGKDNPHDHPDRHLAAVAELNGAFHGVTETLSTEYTEHCQIELL